MVSIGAERELIRGLFVGGDYVRQHLSGIDRSVDLNAPAPFDRTAPGQVRTVAAANATRPILPVNGGVRQVSVLTNLGTADYHGLQTNFSYRGNSRIPLDGPPDRPAEAAPAAGSPGPEPESHREAC